MLFARTPPDTHAWPPLLLQLRWKHLAFICGENRSKSPRLLELENSLEFHFQTLYSIDSNSSHVIAKVMIQHLSSHESFMCQVLWVVVYTNYFNSLYFSKVDIIIPVYKRRNCSVKNNLPCEMVGSWVKTWAQLHLTPVHMIFIPDFLQMMTQTPRDSTPAHGLLGKSTEPRPETRASDNPPGAPVL